MSYTPTPVPTPGPSAGRTSYVRSVLGPKLFQHVKDAKVLVVGAGGIGCELLKNLVMVGFGHIDIVDLDTIDLSNLNRQFLFGKKHIKKPKAIVAKETASAFNPHVSITAIHANIKDPQFDIAYYKKFNMVLNALDNLDARRWVNKMCIASGVSLVESGTTGFLGQVQPIQKGTTECYDCNPKPIPKSYPVCTIRSTPSTPIHCIVWAKSYLFTQLFGEDDETGEQELDKAIANGENATEIENLRKEAMAFRDMRASLGSDANAKAVFNKIFDQDVRRLLSMEDMWKTRAKPAPLDYDSALHDDLIPPAAAKAAQPAANGTDGHTSTSNLKDQKLLTLRENVELFTSSLQRLSARAKADPSTPLEFDKDDDDTLDFVFATSNLRARVYGIEEKTRFQVKEMAGNIIPAIATTNAIIAGALVLQSLNVLRSSWSSARFVSLSRTPQRIFTSMPAAPPNPACSVCRDVYVTLGVEPSKLTLGTFIDEVVNGEMEMEWEVQVFEGERLLADPDFDDNWEKTFEELGLTEGKLVAVSDEDGVMSTVQFVLTALNAPALGKVTSPGLYNLAIDVPKGAVPRKAKPAPGPTDEEADGEEVTLATGANVVKRHVEEEATVTAVDEPKTKRVRPTEGDGEGSGGGSSKETAVELADDDVIVLD